MHSAVKTAWDSAHIVVPVTKPSQRGVLSFLNDNPKKEGGLLYQYCSTYVALSLITVVRCVVAAGQVGMATGFASVATANCTIIGHFSAFKSGLVAPFLYAA